MFNLVSSFSRSSRLGGGSSIFVRNILHTNHVDYLKELGSENNFELSAVEIIDFNFIVCMYVCIGPPMENLINFYIN